MNQAVKFQYTETKNADLAFNSIKVLGLRIAAVQIPDAIRLVESWIQLGDRTRYLLFGGMHGVMEAQKSRAVYDAWAEADLIVADGMPLVWLARLHGNSNMLRRVYGPEFMLTLCQESKGKYRHFLYGGNEGVVDVLAGKLQEKFGTNIVGTITPPFRPLSEMECSSYAKKINESQADIVWVGIGTPKQDLFMQKIRPLLKVPVMFGVGAAFDFNAGLKSSSPRWMQDHGLEWLYRLVTEPRRLWYRYIVLGSQFVVLASLDFLRQKLDAEKRQGPN